MANNLETLIGRVSDLATWTGDTIQLRGVPEGGTTGQVLRKVNGTDFNLQWADAPTGVANLTFSRTATTVTVISDTGTDAVLPVADASNAGVLSSADKAKLDLQSGTNTGDQDLSGYATISSLAGYQPLDSDLTSWAGVTRGTGFDTAAAVNVGSAGAFVVLGGVGGTPSSLTLTNATGLPVAGISGLGTTVATTLGQAINSASGMVTQSGADTRYGQEYRLVINADLSADSTTYVYSTESLVLPAGKYRFEATMIGRTASSTGGFRTYLNLSNNSVDFTSGAGLISVTSAEGSGNTPQMYSRSSSNILQYMVYSNADPSGTHKLGQGVVTGTTETSASITCTFKVQQQVTDAANPAFLKRGSYVTFTRIP